MRVSKALSEPALTKHSTDRQEPIRYRSAATSPVYATAANIVRSEYFGSLDSEKYGFICCNSAFFFTYRRYRFALRPMCTNHRGAAALPAAIRRHVKTTVAVLTSHRFGTTPSSLTRLRQPCRTRSAIASRVTLAPASNRCKTSRESGVTSGLISIVVMPRRDASAIGSKM